MTGLKTLVLFLFVVLVVGAPTAAFATANVSKDSGLREFIGATCGSFEERVEENQAACMKSASDFIKKNPLDESASEDDVKLYQANLVENVCGNTKFANHVQGPSRYNCIQAGLKALSLKDTACSYKTVFGMTTCLFDELASYKSELSGKKGSVGQMKSKAGRGSASIY